MSDNAQAMGAFRELRRFVRPREQADEQCELCGAAIGEPHHHLLQLNDLLQPNGLPQLSRRRIVCGCEACAILFSDQAAGGYRRIPTDIRALRDFAMDDAQWEELSIPINMAFFCRTGNAAEPTAFYPSPGGPTQANVGADSWQHIVEQNPLLQKMASDVEALLVNRLSRPHEYFIVPIDECYRLIGLIRTQWRGFSGGKDVWEAISGFFASIRNRAVREGPTHA
jgi:hypothetical protein